MKLFLTFILVIFSSLTFANSQIHLTQENAVEYHSYYFGNVRVGSSNPVAYKVTNDGTSDLVFQKATIQGMFYTAYHNCNKTLAPKATCSFTVYYSPLFEGYHYGAFRLVFDQGNEIHLDLTGWAQNQ